jgi:hypothetical protein
MKKILLILGSAAFALAVRGNTIVVDTIGPSNTYSQVLAYGIGPGGAAEAAKFTALASGNLATVDLGLTYISTPGPISAFLYTDAAGLPNNANQTLLGVGTPTAQYNTSNNSFVSFSVLGNVPVTIGSLYWLVVKAAAPNTIDAWNFSVGAIGTTAFTNDGTTWNGPIQESILPAFRLTVFDQVTNGVPDTGSTIFLMICSVGALLGLRRMLPALAVVGLARVSRL